MAIETGLLPPDCPGYLWYHAETLPMLVSHSHAELEVNLARAGSAAYLLGNRRYDLAPCTMTWLFPAQDHILLEQSPGYQMWIGVFSPALVARVCHSAKTQILAEANPVGRFCRIVPEAEADWLHRLFLRVARSGRDAALREAALGHALLAAWDVWDAAEDVPRGASIHPAVEQAARLLRDEAEALTLEQIAERVGLSGPRLSLLFKQQTGVPLAQFRNRQRLERFFRITGEGRRITLLDAALEAGWGSYPQFHRVFTQLMGCSPVEYRRRIGRSPQKDSL